MHSLVVSLRELSSSRESSSSSSSSLPPLPSSYSSSSESGSGVTFLFKNRDLKARPLKLLIEKYCDAPEKTDEKGVIEWLLATIE